MSFGFYIYDVRYANKSMIELEFYDRTRILYPAKIRMFGQEEIRWFIEWDLLTSRLGRSLRFDRSCYCPLYGYVSREAAVRGMRTYDRLEGFKARLLGEV